MLKKIMIAGFLEPDERYENYAMAMEKLGAEPFVSLDIADYDKADGLILPGSRQDMNPKLWGAEDECSNDINDDLDAVQWALMEKAAADGKPVLGICRGMQFINVFFGGTLIQDLPDAEAHKAAPKGEPENCHKLFTVEETALYELYPVTTEVNTRHHQGVGCIGDKLKVSALWMEGMMPVMEAIEHKELPIIGVQWHPERMYLYGDEQQQADGEKLLKYWLERI
ncbi:MAG: gamma-glutamyl-gamma-aminobutyrate hydrolase family protein [Firmicutes bacterium]|nr:gamma-glutamyl-gamma-aminobutyrate hydrolase family protein [Bacillota bacterium]